MSGLFITGTGTGIGKTLVATLLIAQLSGQGREVRALKPLISGFDPAEPGLTDTGLLLTAMGRRVTPDAVAEISPWRLAAPLSPDMAAAREGVALSAAEITAFCRAQERAGTVTLVEGVGGVMVPLNDTETTLHVMAALGWPALLVTGSYLGTLSHTLTAVQALGDAEVPLAGVVISESPESPVPLAETAASLLRFLPGVAVLALPRFDPASGPPENPPDLAGLVPTG